MPKGKRGPIPDAINEPHPEPPIENIIGEENVVDAGTSDRTDDPPLVSGGYKCADCTFTGPLLSEIEEHCSGSGHGGYGQATPQQAALFREPGVIYHTVQVPLEADFLNEKRQRLADLYQSALDIKEEKKEADSDFNTRLKNIDEQMQQIARVLKTPYTYDKVKCEWRIIEEENARGLYRLDTGEMVDKQPLTMEDRITEEQAAAAENATL